LPRESWVKISQVRTLSVDRLGTIAGRLDDADVDRVADGLSQLIR
jgi:mRNA interferase MazF